LTKSKNFKRHDKHRKGNKIMQGNKRQAKDRDMTITGKPTKIT